MQPPNKRRKPPSQSVLYSEAPLYFLIIMFVICNIYDSLFFYRVSPIRLNDSTSAARRSVQMPRSRHELTITLESIEQVLLVRINQRETGLPKEGMC